MNKGPAAQRKPGASPALSRAAFGSLPANIAILDHSGTIVAVNRAWRDFAEANAGAIAATCEGANYLEVCERARGDDAAEGRAMAQGIRRLLGGNGKEFVCEYACHSPSEQRWFMGRASRLLGDGRSRVVVAHVDVTQRVFLQTRARMTSRRLRHFLDLSPNVNYALRIERGQFVTEWVSDNILRLVGHTVDQALAPGWWVAHLHPDDRQAALQHEEDALREGAAQSEYRFRHAGGAWIWVRDHMHIERDADGSPLRLIGAWTDITERRAARDALEQSEARFRATFEQAAVGITHIAPDGRFIDVNARMCQITGYARDELLALTIQDLRHPDDLERDLAWMNKLFAGEVANYTLEKRCLHKDGHHVWIDLTVSPVRHDGGHPDYLVCVIEDISQRRQIEERALRLSQAVEQSFDSIMIADAQGCIEYVNEAFTRISGYARDELLGQNPRILQSGQTPPETYAAMWTALRAGRPWRGEFHNRRKDGTQYLEAAVISPIRQADGRITHYVAAKEDITERRRFEIDRESRRQELEEQVRLRTAQLEQARAQADAANQAKSAFLANMSHEIRTPMNGVLGMIELLERSQLTEAQTEMVRSARDSGRALLGIIDDILDLSKIEAGRQHIEAVPMSVIDVAEAVCDALLPEAARQEVRLSVFVDPAIPERVLSDPLRLRQILFNLLGNAIKFSGGRPGRRGQVCLRVTASPAAPLRLVFVVADNGIGMAEEALARLFAPFTQAEASTTRRFGGTGLGLTICKRLADLLGGEIAVSSRPGEGSTFTLTLPIDSAPDQPARLLPDLSGVDCLLSESPELDVEGLAAYLQAAGARVHRVADMACGEQVAKGLDGPKVGIRYIGKLHPARIETFRAVDNMRYLFIMQGRRRRARIAMKQIVTLDDAALRRQSLLHAVAVAAARASPQAAPTTGAAMDVAQESPAAPSVAQARERGALILVAEDDPINRRVIARQLDLLGRAAEVAVDGAEALRMWRDGRHALLLTDLHMPGMDGYALAEAIRREEASKRAGAGRMPILALTADVLRDGDERTRAAGMQECLVKPLQLEQLRMALDRWLPPVGRSAGD